VELLQGDVTDIQDALARLQAVNTADFWEGEAADAFAGARDDVAPDLEQVIRRIQLVAHALAAFIPSMDDCQRRARLAVHRARQAEDELVRAHHGAEDAARQAAADRAAAERFAEDNPGVPRPQPPAYWGPNWNGMITDAEEERALAARLFGEAVHDYQAAAHRCAEAVENAADDGLRNPRRRGGVGGLFDDVADGLGAVGGAALRGAESLGRAAARGAAEVAEQAADMAENATDAASVAWNAAADAAQEFADATVAAAGFVVEHLDVVSEGLGIAAMVTGFIPGMQGISLAISGVKLALDVGLVLAGEGDMGAVWGDLAGFALFGAGRAFTGLARARAGRDALLSAQRSAAQVRTLTAEVAQSENLARNAARLPTLGQKFQQATQTAQRFGADAGRPAWQQTVHMFRNLNVQVPEAAALNLSRTAATYAEAAAVTEAVSTSLGVDGIGDTLRKRDLLPDYSQP
jgi:uncharacterized protein YukE